jgi:hypothetical protein
VHGYFLIRNWNLLLERICDCLFDKKKIKCTEQADFVSYQDKFFRFLSIFLATHVLASRMIA